MMIGTLSVNDKKKLLWANKVGDQLVRFSMQTNISFR